MAIFTYIALVLTLYGFWAQIMRVLTVLTCKEGATGSWGFWFGAVFLCATIALGVHVGW